MRPFQCPIFTYTIKDKKGTDLSGTNTMYEGADVKPVKEGDVVRCVLYPEDDAAGWRIPVIHELYRL